MQKLFSYIIALMSDASGAPELSSYSFVISSALLHALLVYHELFLVPAIHTTLTEYATAMGLIASGHGIAYLTRK